MKMNNLNLIANYLFNNPGARYSEITKMLCRIKAKPWHNGMFSRYFTRPNRFTRNIRYAERLWEKTPCGGWMLTLKGMSYVTGEANVSTTA